IWVFDLVGSEQPAKLTFDGHNAMPMWSPDDRELMFVRATPDGIRRLSRLPSDGSRLTPEVGQSLPLASITDLSPDGRSLLFTILSANNSVDLMLAKAMSSDPPTPWLNERFTENFPAFSPDGKWVAYVSTQSDTSEIWVRPFPGPGAPVR